MSAATSAIAVIRDEHRSIAAVLRGLVRHIEEVSAGELAPDFPLFMARFEYLEVVPERIHHPKEDQYLFRLLRQRTPEGLGIFDELEAEHAENAPMLARLRFRLEQFHQHGDVLAFEQALKAYANFNWDHMGKEENIVLPLAERYLTPADWQLIDTAFAANRSE
jgi:branched-chain amino acid transport system ATP-binding protein